MTITSHYTANAHLPKLPLLPTKPSQSREFRIYRRRRLKPNRRLKAVQNQSGSSIPTPFENLFHSLITQFPSVNSLNLFAPALGFASGVALYLSRFNPHKTSRVLDIGEWIFFASPTPFNRFVLLRCPSISFQGSEYLEDVNEKLVKEERHYVTVNSGRIQVRSGERVLEDGKMNYQRVCVTTEDGGVISLDWPANLDLEEERGLDSTLLLVPGTPEGSMERNTRSFVLEALKRGFFPVVMNPRGCAGSPLTTARLFTAADSDDIYTAIKYINTARPWTTLMGVGWGYGANMLTKYLAEVGEKTPLTAATCIDNPFDLEEATRSSPYNIAIDQKLTGGLIEILRTNKELFQGKTKGFDVEKALLAESVRDFEKAISMVSHGFGAIEDFYSKSSTRNVIGKIKIPVLFIQSDDATVPVFSIPRSLIAENPFTNLLLCSCLPSSVIDIDRSAMSWCQLLTIEWLTAVELGLLKGRHPLLTDIDVTVNPSEGLSFVEDIRSDKRTEAGRLLDLTRSDVFDGYTIDPAKDMLEGSNNGASLGFGYQQDLQRHLKPGDTSLEVDNGPFQQITSTDVDLIEEENVSEDSEHGQVLQTAQVVMNMLDVTMPGTLTEEKKKKVLTAVGQGETLMKALQDAVPEDVRGKLTAAVSGILHTQGTNMKFDRVLSVAQAPPNTLPGRKNQEKFTGVSGSEGLSEDQSSSNQMKSSNISTDGHDGAPSGMGEPTEGTESEVHPSQKPQISTNLAQSQDPNSEVSSSGSVNKETSRSRSNNDINEESKEVVAPDIDHSDKEDETVFKSHPANQHDQVAAAGDELKSQNSGIVQTDTKEENNIQKVEQKTQDLSSGQSKTTTANTKEEAPSSVSSEPQATEREGSNSSGQSETTSTDTKEEAPSPVSSEPQETQREGSNIEKKENNNLQHITDQTNSNSSGSSASPFSVSQALDALSGIDDSTQVAVNSVFGVLENMLSQLEESSDNEDEIKDEKDGDQEFQEKQKSNSQSMESNTPGDPSVHHHHDGSYLKNNACSMEEQQTQKSNTDDHVSQKKSKLNGQLIGKRLLLDKQDGHRLVNKMPHLAANSYRDPIYSQYLVSKIPTKSLDLDTTTALFLDYFPEEGQWKLLEQPQNTEISSIDVEGAGWKMKAHAKSSDTEQCIEPPYVILHSEKQQEPVKEFITTDNKNEKIDTGSDRSEELIQFVKKNLLNSLKMEVDRKLNSEEMKEMKLKVSGDLEHVANAISQAIRHSEIHLLHTETLHNIRGAEAKFGILDGEHIVRVISSSVHETGYLRRVMPVGVIVGTILASLRKYFHVATAQDNGLRGFLIHDDGKKPCRSNFTNVGETEIDHEPEEKTSLDDPIESDGVKGESEDVNQNSVMVGAVTAALGASALLMQQQDSEKFNETSESSSPSLKKSSHKKESEKLDELVSDKNQSNIVTSLAEKAMSVAGPVVPTKDDGEVDQERLVAMLADLGQKGGFLKLVGKIALLWGGLRGAMSLTDRLISFLRIAERPLFQRICGFVGMVLVLWSPVAIPLLPTLVQSWTKNTPSRIAELACIFGLYTAFMILIMLWGKRIRGYGNALEQYGLDISTPKLFDFFKGLVGGVILVSSIHAINAFLGWASFSWPPTPPSLDIMTWLKVHWKMVVLVVQGTVMATAIALVEELLFRSWLPQEIAVDLGYYRGIIMSGLAFSLCQRSPQAIPALWFLSLSLSGLRERNGGSLSIPIGLRTGMMASNFILQKGNFLAYRTSFSPWLIGTHPFQPFSGIVGLLFSISLAILLHPKQKERVAQE
ncbi:Embryogenesis-associated protein EMB8 isoform B [Senna tora]|uniref:Embryogenesis-associated protein EMB8 isoform B n=1 Tax=Senna tora TaxID=362788 RepID=A0A834X271_9FABA|nr:Embryogenesis-associated protein EMB8 isoform B [Senna tora]